MKVKRSHFPKDSLRFEGRRGSGEVKHQHCGVRFGRTIAAREGAHVATFTANPPGIAQSNVVLITYKPQVHFTRKVVTPVLRLADWGA